MPPPKTRKRPSRRFLGRLTGFALRLFLFILVLTSLQVAILRFINPPFTATMAWEWIYATFSSANYIPPSMIWRPLEEVSPHLKRAVLAAEDQRFMNHHGFDFVELEKAIEDALHNKGVRGASTISMQAARTVFLWPDRTLVRKAFEAYYTVLIELFWDKHRILEVYINMVDWGRGVRGAEAACRAYFNVGCDEVSRYQAAALAAILPNPYRWSPVEPEGRPALRTQRILRAMDMMPQL
ncbi:MAG: monofunctional biosynthetic peptidoglycan transglycosylase [Desulfobacteraceae bacterium]